MARLVFLGLNAVRFLSIVSLLLVFASSIIAMVTNIKAVNRFHRTATPTDAIPSCDDIEGSTVQNRPTGLFWAVAASALIVFRVIILILAELRWPAVFFDRFFPVLGNGFGLGALGIFQALIGAQMLSRHAIDELTRVSAYFLFSIGCLNMLLGVVFRAGAKSKRSLRGEKKGIIIGDKFHVPGAYPDDDVAASWESTDKASYADAYLGAQEKSADDVAASWKGTDKASYAAAYPGAQKGIIIGDIRPHVLDTAPQFQVPGAYPGAQEKSADDVAASWESPDKASYAAAYPGAQEKRADNGAASWKSTDKASYADAYPGAQEKRADDGAASSAPWKSTDKASYADAYPGAQEKSADDGAASSAPWKSTDKASDGFALHEAAQRPEEALPPPYAYAPPTATFAAPEAPPPSPTLAAPPRARQGRHDYKPSSRSAALPMPSRYRKVQPRMPAPLAPSRQPIGLPRATPTP